MHFPGYTRVRKDSSILKYLLVIYIESMGSRTFPELPIEVVWGRWGITIL